MIASGAELPVLGNIRSSIQIGEIELLHTFVVVGGLGAVLEQEGHVIAYASRALTEPERHYSVIQKECLALVYALKHFRHYLLGSSFQLITDHALLHWLSVQKMKGMLCRWALSMQEYDFQIVYRKGALNTNTDVLSQCNWSDTHSCAVTSAMPHTARDELHHVQQTDSHLATVIQVCTQFPHRPMGPEWRKQSLQRYRQLWSQLRVVNGTLYRHFAPGPTSESVPIPILLSSLRKQAFLQNHNAPSAGHQGPDHTLEQLRQEAYWVNMAIDVEKHCKECTT